MSGYGCLPVNSRAILNPIRPFSGGGKKAGNIARHLAGERPCLIPIEML